MHLQKLGMSCPWPSAAGPWGPCTSLVQVLSAVCASRVARVTRWENTGAGWGMVGPLVPPSPPVPPHATCPGVPCATVAGHPPTDSASWNQVASPKGRKGISTSSLSYWRVFMMESVLEHGECGWGGGDAGEGNGPEPGLPNSPPSCLLPTLSYAAPGGHMCGLGGASPKALCKHSQGHRGKGRVSCNL